jgi:hypothetical protein
MAAPRSELQVWIKRERKLPRPDFPKGWPIEELSRRMFALGYTEAKPGTIQIWEAPKGRDPGAENIEGLEKVFGSKAPGQKETGPSTMGEAGQIAAVLREAIEAQTTAIVAAIHARDQTLEHLLSELGRYRSSQLDVLRALQDTAHPEGPMPGDEPEHEPHAAAPNEVGRR